MDGIKDGAVEGMELTSYADSPSDQPSPDSGNKRRRADITISNKDSHMVMLSAPLHAVKPWGGSEGCLVYMHIQYTEEFVLYFVSPIWWIADWL